MIVGRDAELGRLDELLAGLREGAGLAVVVHGEPGIGKTTLLDAVLERARDTVTTLRARGAESEGELAFSALVDLLEPVLRDLQTLPAAQEAALAGALALAPPAPGDRLAVCVATLGLLRAATERGPVLVVVDDLQWVDASSRECIEYVARRASGSLAVVMAARDPWQPPQGTRLEEIALHPLDADGAASLLRHRAHGLTPQVAAAVVAAAAGNPLALVELPGTLTPRQRAGIDALELPLVPGDRLGQAFAARIEAMDEGARRALLIAATETGGDLQPIAAACRRAETDVRRLTAAEAHGLVRLEPARVTFVHPLIRGAVYAGANAAEKRVAHSALAGAVRDERRVWHLAAAAVGPDERVAMKLERVGNAAVGRRAYAPASAAFERAAELSSHPNTGSRRLVAAGEAAGAAGAPDRALAVLGEASRLAPNPAARARAEHLRGRIMAWSGSQLEATALLVLEADRVASSDPVLAATMLADAANGYTHVNRYLRAEELATRAVALLGELGEPSERAPVLTALGWVLVLRGHAPRGRLLLREAEHLADGLDPLGPHWPWLHLLLRALIPLGELERAHAECANLCDRARDAGALSTLGGALLVAADVAFRLGDWTDADDASREAIRVAGDAGQSAWLGFALSTRARLMAAQGLEQESRAAARRAQIIAGAGGVSSGLRFVRGALGFLALTLGRIEDAVAELAPIEEIVEGSGLEEPTLVPWAPDLIEAYARAGAERDAVRVLTTLERQAASSHSAFAGAAAARCRGMLVAPFEPHFRAAFAFDDRRPMPFERARTLLAYGRRLHRAGRRTEARERLREAKAGFERLGATGWVAQAENELRAAGARRRTARSDALTAQELRVAEAVRNGASNRQIAAQLFLSPKTIDFHLRQIYRKLGVHSRTQLVAALHGEDAATGGTARRRQGRGELA